MIKYIITTGRCSISCTSSKFEELNEFTFEASVDWEPKTFDTIGEAMTCASKVNELLGHACFKVESIEVGNSENNL